MTPDEEEPNNQGDAKPEPRAEEESARQAIEPPQLSEAAPPEDRIVETLPILDGLAVAQEPSVPELLTEPEPTFVEEEPVAAYEPPPESTPDPVFEEPAFEAPPEPVKAYEPPLAPKPVYVEPEPPAPVYEEPVAEPPSRIHEAAARQLHEEPLPELERTYGEAAQRSAFDEAEYPFGEPEIPMPEPAARPGDRQRRRDAKRNLDLDLGRIKRRKRYGLFITSVTVLFIAFVLAPVTWATAYLFFDPPSTVLMMQRAAEGQTIRHYPVPINRMSPHIVRAVIAAEDANFCSHDGFDIEAIQDAMESNRRGGRTRGASTVSQQTAKNLFLWPERSWVRKGFETYFTALIEFLWPKRRIMEAYLNAAEWGDGNFGIEAAARARFGVSAADLTPLQAARLAAVLPSPNRWRADNPGPYVRGRASTIVARSRDVRTSGMAGCVLTLDRPNTEGATR